MPPPRSRRWPDSPDRRTDMPTATVTMDHSGPTMPPPKRRSQRLTTMFGRQPLGMALAAPYVVFLAAVFAYPLGLAVYMSFHRYFFTAPGAVEAHVHRQAQRVGEHGRKEHDDR